MSEPCRVGVGLLAFALCLSGPVNARADVTVSLADGRATVVARNATLRQVLAEWARIGGTRIVNLERVAGAPDSFELRNVPEAKALAMLLRSVAGYIAAPRPATSRGASIYDRILILPTSVASMAPMGPLRAGPAPPPPVFEPAPDPSALANDDANETTTTTAAPAFPGNGQEGATPGPPAGPPPPMTTPGVTPYAPNPADPASALTGQPSAPPTQPNAGQFTAPQPGVLPPPSQTQQQPKP
jgi:hypothetical protein